MRKTSPVFVVILLVVIGCGSSDEDESTLVGSWEIVSIGGQPLSTVASLFAFFLSLSPAFEAEGQIEGIESRVIKNDFVFAADSSYSSTVGFEWTVNKNNGASITLRRTSTSKGKYTLSGSKISLDAEEEDVIPNLDQPATNTKKVSTITDPRKRVSSL